MIFSLECEADSRGSTTRRETRSVCQILSPLGTIGSDVKRLPVARKMALPIAGATATIGVSPAPADGKSFRSSNTVSSTGIHDNCLLPEDAVKCRPVLFILSDLLYLAGQTDGLEDVFGGYWLRGALHKISSPFFEPVRFFN